MNIFYLDKNPQRCAQMHVDKHCVKMILEYAQLLSTAHRYLDGVLTIGLSQSGRKRQQYILNDEREQMLYSATHINHPSAVWCRQSSANYMWLAELLEECCKEYTYRYGKIHKVESSGLMQILKNVFPINIADKPFTEPTPAMPDECKVPGDSITSYHNYYFTNKEHLWSWKGKINSRERPRWMSDMAMTKLHQTNEELGLTY
jgi:hypothetical protein